ncbi:hypothetical protein YC2023_032427 [Brassica napus]
MLMICATKMLGRLQVLLESRVQDQKIQMYVEHLSNALLLCSSAEQLCSATLKLVVKLGLLRVALSGKSEIIHHFDDFGIKDGDHTWLDTNLISASLNTQVIQHPLTCTFDFILDFVQLTKPTFEFHQTDLLLPGESKVVEGVSAVIVRQLLKDMNRKRRTTYHNSVEAIKSTKIKLTQQVCEKKVKISQKYGFQLEKAVESTKKLDEDVEEIEIVFEIEEMAAIVALK